MTATNKKLGIGIAGCGVISYEHARSILNTNDTHLVAASSRSAQNRKKFADEFHVSMFADYDEMLKQDNLDAVAICTPSGTHLEIGMKAAEAGKHVIVEKPIDVSVDRGQKLIDSCEKNGVKLAVIYQNRYSDAVLKLKEAVASGKIGKPVMARGTVKWFRSQEYYSDSGWRGTLDLDGGGALINQSIHTIDLLTWVLCDITCVFGLKDTLTHKGIEAEDNLVATLKFASGILGQFEASTSIVPPQPRTIEINGSEGTAILKGNEFHLLTGGDEESVDFDQQEEESFFVKQYSEIVSAILNGDQPPVSGQEALKSLAVVEAIYDSCGDHTAVNPSKYIDEQFQSSKNFYS